MTHLTPDVPPPYPRYAAALGRLPASDRSRPLGLLDLDAFHANAAALRARAGGVPLRVASKSLRIRRAVEEALALPGFAGIMTFTLAEALWWAESGETDLLVAYPSVDEAALTAWMRSAGAREAIAVTVDSREQLDLLNATARRARVHGGAGLPPLRICLDVDAAWEPFRGRGRVHLGALRSAIRTAAQARELASAIAATPGMRLAAVLAYEGQVAGLPEGRGPRAAAVRLIKSASVRELAARRPAVVAAVREVARAAGADLDFVNGGGTGSVETTRAEGCVTEIGVGSGLMGPASFDGFRGFRTRPASFYARPVVRRPAPDVVAVAGGGWIASGVPGADRAPIVAWPAGLRYSGLEGPGEVQTPLRGAAAARLRLGDLVIFRHAKAGEPAEHLEAMAVYSAQRDEIVDLWPTYRGEGRIFA